jgi:hypothetical protein
MRVILSRKGFDKQYGGQPSPIMPDGTLLSLPIPGKKETVYFSGLKHNGKTYLDIMQELNHNSNPKIKEKYTCHLDPDLRNEVCNRENGWDPLFGQTGGAQGHLLKQKISEKDLFLFFGWFKETEVVDGILKYKRNAADLHLIFGYMQIGKIYPDISKLPKEYQYHPHAQARFKDVKPNCIYKATDTLSFVPSLAGGGCLSFDNTLVLTKKGFTKSRWGLPSFFRNIKISYHSSSSFAEDYFQSAAKGQEFVIEENEHVSNWAKEIIIAGSKAKLKQ